MSKKISIIFVESYGLFRQALESLLSKEPDFDFIGGAANENELLNLMNRKVPDIALIDLHNNVMSEQEMLTKISRQYSTVGVIILSDYITTMSINDLTAIGARGFIHMNAEYSCVLDAIKIVNSGGYYIDKNIPTSSECLQFKGESTIDINMHLSEKEIRILWYVCAGKLTKQIASDLEVTERTIERYKTSLYRKTKTKSLADLIMFAVKHNFTERSKEKV